MDGTTPVVIWADPATHELLTSAAVTVDSITTVTTVVGITNTVNISGVKGGGTELGALRVTLANDSTGVLSIDDNGSTVSIDGTLTGITNTVSITGVTGGGTELGSLRVTLANDSTGLLSIDDNGGSVTIDGTITGITNTVTTKHAIITTNHGITTVATAGTDLALAASTVCRRVTIQAQTDNTGYIAVGGSGVDATEATGTGVLLLPGDSFELEIDNLSKVFIDSTVSGDGVRYTYFA